MTSMWTARSTSVAGDRGQQFAIDLDARPASYQEVLRGWHNDADFRSQFNTWLAEAPYAAFRWETPPVTAATRSRPFEFVILDSPGLARRPEPESFAEHFGRSEDSILTFENLGRDAVLVVPRPLSAPTAYAHLADFVRNGPEAQRDQLWSSVAEAMQRRIGRRPVWLSTAGAGVSWLHVRLDDRPKYYGFEPYRSCVETE